MNKEDYCNSLRNKLERIPLDERRKWSETDLFYWWLKVIEEDSYLRWERARGDVWQYVPGMCRDLIGPNAL